MEVSAILIIFVSGISAKVLNSEKKCLFAGELFFSESGRE